jgi:prepilin-type N-terminal cleavage/methylation domain-containing protein
MTKVWRALRGARGFSLAELLVVCAIAGIFLSGVIALQLQGQRAYSIGAARVDAQQNARLALERFLEELRIATAVTSATNCSNSSTGASTLSFSWTNPISFATETLTWALSGTNLQRTDTSGTVTIIGGVTGLNIWCYQSDGVTLTSTAANVYSVIVKLTAQDETVASSHQTTVVQSRVRLRNL